MGRSPTALNVSGRSTKGVEGTFMWFMEEVGELSAALRGGSHEERLLEFLNRREEVEYAEKPPQRRLIL